jgi:hypothetical protein
MEYMVPIIIVPGFFIAVVLAIRLVVSNRRRIQIATLHAELHRHLLEKFGSASEALQYLQSDAGKSVLDATLVEQANPFGRVLGSVQAGLITLGAGIAMLISQRVIRDGDAADGFYVMGMLGLMIGIGFLASAAISYVLIRRWGLVSRPSQAQ